MAFSAASLAAEAAKYFSLACAAVTAFVVALADDAAVGGKPANSRNSGSSPYMSTRPVNCSGANAAANCAAVAPAKPLTKSSPVAAVVIVANTASFICSPAVAAATAASAAALVAAAAAAAAAGSAFISAAAAALA